MRNRCMIALTAVARVRTSRQSAIARPTHAPLHTRRHRPTAAPPASTYAILSAAREDRPYGIGPGGLQSGYNGHSFWE